MRYAFHEWFNTIIIYLIHYEINEVDGWYDIQEMNDSFD